MTLESGRVPRKVGRPPVPGCVPTHAHPPQHRAGASVMHFIALLTHAEVRDRPKHQTRFLLGKVHHSKFIKTSPQRVKTPKSLNAQKKVDAVFGRRKGETISGSKTDTKVEEVGKVVSWNEEGAKRKDEGCQRCVVQWRTRNNSFGLWREAIEGRWSSQMGSSRTRQRCGQTLGGGTGSEAWAVEIGGSLTSFDGLTRCLCETTLGSVPPHC